MLRFLHRLSAPQKTSRLPGVSLGGTEDRRLTGLYFLRISALGLGISALAGSFTLIVLPARILDVAPEEHKNAYLALLSFVGLLIAVVAQPLFGGLSDRWGRRGPFMAIGAAASVPFLLAAGVVPSYALLFAIVCLLQVCSNGALGPYQALIRDLVPLERRGAASGMKVLLESSGAMGVAAVVGVLMGLYASGGNLLWVWAATALLASVLLVGAAVTTATVRRGEAAASPRRPPGEQEKGSTQAHHDFRWFLMSRLLIAVGAASMQTYLFFYLEDVVGIGNPARAIAILLPTVGVTVLLVSYPAGVLADRVGRKPVMAAAGVIGAVVVILLLLARSLAGVLASGVVGGIALGMYLGAYWAMASDLVSARRTAQQLGYLNLATAGGAGLARLNGLWVDRLNTADSDLGYTTLLIVCGVLFLAGNFLILRVRIEHRRQGHALPEATSS